MSSSPATGSGVALLRAKTYLIRHRFDVRDLTLLFAAVATTAYVLLEVDLFASVGGVRSNKPGIEPDELFVLGTVLCVGLLIFAWRRLRAQKAETRRRISAESRAHELAFEDPLTGLPNRRQFDDTLQVAIASPPPAGAAHAVMMLDLNGFKQVNDVHGHSAGDATLIAVSGRLLSAVRKGDLVARFGGDEFAVIAKHLSGPEAATGLALRLIETLAKPVAVGSLQHQLGVGIGICLLPYDGCTVEETVRRADIALYRAKADRRSALRFFDEEMDRHVRERDRLELALRSALANHEITPVFQPAIDLRSKRVTGFEALPCWRHPRLGEIPPERFIPLAEDTGLIQELTGQLLRSACRTAGDWPSHVTLAINLSSEELHDPNLCLRLLAILGETGLPPQRLEIEITESAVVRDVQMVKETLGPLRDAGVRIALDHFGTGYSTLYHLRSFKFDKVKIDRSFVEDMRRDGQDSGVIGALIGLGRGLGFTIGAEGIEAVDQGSKLLASGCEQGQGGFFSGAVTAEGARGLLDQAEPAAMGKRRA
jgi:diguanylate cyclase (GGDEF)-like protein